ncbi:hypothetical protein [Halorhabdus rudnickae]|uniref:hypothetical protein n=1 Tax=Halorhabdus rudnickae TaxID=1775544 RepID=UPI00108415DE|nr:hypothetical protein [Halorhabdus rudnickae]
MSAIDTKESVRYAGRLFGYFLMVTLVGGGITVGGAVLLWNNDLFSGGSVDVGAEIIVGGTLTGVGALVILAGFFTIVCNVIADGIRFGVPETGSDAEESPERPREPAWAPVQYRPIADAAPPMQQRAPARDPNHQQPGERDREAQPEENEAWKREVEEDLADGDRPGQEEAAPPAGEETSPEPEPASDSTGRAETGVEREPSTRNRGTSGSATGDDTPPTSETARRDTEPWVSGEDVSSGDPTDRAETDQEGGSGASASDDPLAPGEADDRDRTDSA